LAIIDIVYKAIVVNIGPQTTMLVASEVQQTQQPKCQSKENYLTIA